MFPILWEYWRKDFFFLFCLLSFLNQPHYWCPFVLLLLWLFLHGGNFLLIVFFFKFLLSFWVNERLGLMLYTFKVVERTFYAFLDFLSFQRSYLGDPLFVLHILRVVDDSFCILLGVNEQTLHCFVKDYYSH